MKEKIEKIREESRREQEERDKERKLRDAEREREYKEWKDNHEREIEKKDLEDKLDFLSRYPNKYMINDQGRIVPIPVPNDDGLGEEINDDLELSSTNDNNLFNKR